MATQLSLAVGQCSAAGIKPINQDFHGLFIPGEPLLSTKGIAVAMADGISSSDVSHIASQAAVSGFLADYFCTPEAWSVKKSVHRVLMATNSWLHAQSRHSRFCYDLDRGYVCTLSALVLKASTAHLFHVGDTRIYRLRAGQLERLTEDHRLWIAPDKSYLSRALGIDRHLELDYLSVPLEKDDVFLLATDGVYEFVAEAYLIDCLSQPAQDLDAQAAAIVAEALQRGSDDNLSVQVVRIEQVPLHSGDELRSALSELPLPPMLEARMQFDGYTIIRPLHASSRSHLFLAQDNDSLEQVALKIPSIDQRNQADYLERFMLEDWIARRLQSAHIVKPCAATRPKQFLYVATEYIDGQTLAQWMLDHPEPELETVRGIVEQIGKGLRAFHRMEMLHQDLRPHNILIDQTGTVKIIDFGATWVAGMQELNPLASSPLLGTAQYTAPEYFLGQAGTVRSDLFSLAVITYQMLCGRLPYGAEVAKCKTRSAQSRLRYWDLHYQQPQIPIWIDDALRKATHPDPQQRQADVAEFLHELRHPNPDYWRRTRAPLLRRDPLTFWKGVSTVLAVLVTLLSLALGICRAQPSPKAVNTTRASPQTHPQTEHHPQPSLTQPCQNRIDALRFFDVNLGVLS